MGYKGGSGSGKGKDFPKAKNNPDGYTAILAAYYLCGTHSTEFKGVAKDRPQVSLVWEIDAQDPDGKPFQLVELNTDSLFKSSRLKKRIEAHIRRPLTEDEEENGFDLDGILGRSVMLYVNDDGYVENVERLQDQTKAIPVRLAYDRMPGLVLYFAKKALTGSIFPWFGYWDGSVPCYTQLHEEDVTKLGDRVQGDAHEDDGEAVDPNDGANGEEPF